MRTRLLTAATVAVLALSGCGDSDASIAPGPDPTPTTGPPDSTEFRDFQADCEQSIANWREGEVGYPATLPARLNQATAYAAAVDVRDDPGVADLVVPSDDPATDDAYFKCVVGARLVALGSGLTVSGDNANGGWLYREFSPAGVLRWSWSVTATAPHDEQLRLDIRPAVDLVDGDLWHMPPHQVSYITDVEVEATAIEHASHWFETQWPLIIGIVAVIGGGVLTVLGVIRRISRWRSPSV